MVQLERGASRVKLSGAGSAVSNVLLFKISCDGVENWDIVSDSGDKRRWMFISMKPVFDHSGTNGVPDPELRDSTSGFSRISWGLKRLEMQFHSTRRMMPCATTATVSSLLGSSNSTGRRYSFKNEFARAFIEASVSRVTGATVVGPVSVPRELCCPETVRHFLPSRDPKCCSRRYGISNGVRMGPPSCSWVCWLGSAQMPCAVVSALFRSEEKTRVNLTRADVKYCANR